MKLSGFWILVLVLGTVLMCLGVSSISAASLYQEMHVNGHLGDGSRMITTSRKLKVISGYSPSIKKQRHAGHVNLDDYQPIDPSPSSKASIKPGPIEHSAPLNPFIPKPSPPPRLPSPSPIGSP